MRDERNLESLIEAVADGRPIDWNAVRTPWNERAQRILQYLRVVAGVAEVHRTMADEQLASTHSDADVSARTGDTTRWGNLVLLEKIGEGAFGEVYRARDPWLDREVALKLLRPTVTDRVPASRIVSEARALARVKHPNAVTVHGADVHDGRAGLWMELVRGATLSQILAAQGPFSAREATALAQDICRALAAVHGAGLVHRDIKAQNVMRESGGRLVLMDFGAGGTPLYLAPEVLAGREPTVASDIYALGVLLYHLVTGRYPLAGTSLQELQAAHLRGDRRRLADERADLPDEFVGIVERALCAAPRERYRTAGEMLEALLATASGFSVISRMRQFLASAGPWPDQGRSIAVLPFVELSPERHLDYFCEGIAEEIINALTAVPGMRVVARSSAFRLAGSVEEVCQVGSLLKVGSVLEGTVRAAGERLRIVARLVDTTDSSQIWSRRFDCTVRDTFTVQEEIAAAVVKALDVGVDQSNPDLSESGQLTRSPEAYTPYLKGRHCWNQRTEATLRKSVSYFLEALEKAPSYPEALAGLAEAYTTLGTYGVLPPHEVMPKAREAARRAIDLAEALASPHATSGCVAAVYEWEWRQAERHFLRAMQLSPNDPVGHHWYAINYLVPLGRFELARRELQHALDADPLSTPIHLSVGLASYFAHDFARARQEIEETLELDPGASTARLFLGLTLVELQRYDEAVRELDTARRLSSSPEMIAALGYAFGRGGQRDRASEALGELQSLSEARYVSPSLMAQVEVALGTPARALSSLERALALHAVDLAWLKVRPVFDALRDQPNFGRLVSAVGLGP
jgi:eukaryotic-like serine/threonine-protein kinase